MADIVTLANFEPLVLPDSPKRSEMLDLASEVIAQGGQLGASLAVPLGRRLRKLTAAVNTYASNLIEGHDTRPLEILKAMNQASANPTDALMIGAVASASLHLRIDDLEVSDDDVFTPEILNVFHRALFKVSPELLEVKGATYCAIPGQLRGPGMNVQVGEHVPPFGEYVDELTSAIFQRYRERKGMSASKLVNAAAMHHRLLHLHPFAEGNGRTIRVLTHAQVRHAGAGGGGLWSISRGLSRGLLTWDDDPKGQYKRLLAAADVIRAGDHDGRGRLTLRGLERFVEWFLHVALDQITYMRGVYALENLKQRLEAVAASTFEGKLREQALPILRRMLHGDVSRREAWTLAGRSERTGRNVVKALLENGIVSSDSERGDLYLTLHYPDVFPGLF